MSDAGFGVLDLVCPEGLVVANLIKQDPHEDVQYATLDGPSRDWPQEQDYPDTTQHCLCCHRPVVGNTSALEAQMTALVANKYVWKGSFELSFAPD